MRFLGKDCKKYVARIFPVILLVNVLDSQEPATLEGFVLAIPQAVGF